MKVIELAGPRIDALRSAIYQDPHPSSGDALIRVRAASLNFLDIALATGKYPVQSFPIIPVTDGAGEIAAVGSAVTDWKVGDRVIPHFIPYWQDGRMPAVGGGLRRGIDLPGSLAEYVTVPARSLVRPPAHLSDTEAATLPIAATTAWRAVRSAGLGPHKTALVLGTGEVSLFAAQFAKAHGARVIVTSSSNQKLERARKLGVDEVIKLTVVTRRGLQRNGGRHTKGRITWIQTANQLARKLIGSRQHSVIRISDEERLAR